MTSEERAVQTGLQAFADTLNNHIQLFGDIEIDVSDADAERMKTATAMAVAVAVRAAVREVQRDQA